MVLDLVDKGQLYSTELHFSLKKKNSFTKSTECTGV